MKLKISIKVNGNTKVLLLKADKETLRRPDGTFENPFGFSNIEYLVLQMIDAAILSSEYKFGDITIVATVDATDETQNPPKHVEKNIEAIVPYMMTRTDKGEIACPLDLFIVDKLIVIAMTEAAMIDIKPPAVEITSVEVNGQWVTSKGVIQ